MSAPPSPIYLSIVKSDQFRDRSPLFLHDSLRTYFANEASTARQPSAYVLGTVFEADGALPVIGTKIAFWSSGRCGWRDSSHGS